MSKKVQVRFSHPKVYKAIKDKYHGRKDGDLHIYTKPDSVAWSYGLNTANYSTYGGEVVQILSVFIEDMQISGMVATYAELERIYEWFIIYMQIASAGRFQSDEAYNVEPVDFYLPHRGWHFKIYPNNLPGFKYGRDVVAPTWAMSAAVFQSDATFDQILQDEKTFNLMHDGNTDFEPFGSATANIGFEQDNPFSGPPDGQVKGNLGTLADFYSGLIDSYTSDDFKNLDADFSRPAFLKGQTGIDIGQATQNADTRSHNGGRK